MENIFTLVNEKLIHHIHSLTPKVLIISLNLSHQAPSGNPLYAGPFRNNQSCNPTWPEQTPTYEAILINNHTFQAPWADPNKTVPFSSAVDIYYVRDSRLLKIKVVFYFTVRTAKSAVWLLMLHCYCFCWLPHNEVQSCFPEPLLSPFLGGTSYQSSPGLLKSLKL